MPLPGKVKEAVTPNEDGGYTIFIEETLSPPHRKKAFLHAIRHIYENDFEKYNVNDIEYKVHFT